MRPPRYAKLAARGARIAAFPFAVACILLRPVSASAALTVFDPPYSEQTYAYSINKSGEVVGNYQTYGGWRGFLRKANGKIKTIEVAGAITTSLNYIGDNGDIVGSYVSPAGKTVGFLRSASGSLIYFHFGSDPTMPECLNARGLIAGNLTDPFNYSRAFVRNTHGKLSRLRIKGQEDTYAWGCNDHGTVAGDHSDWSDGKSHGYIWTGRRVENFDPPNSDNTLVWGLNRGGSVTGWYEDSVNVGKVHGFLRTSNGTITSFDAPQSDGTLAYAINDKGVIVGYYYGEYTDSSGFERGADGTITTFDINQMASIWPRSINDRGVITGICQDQRGEVHGFVGTP